MKTIKDIFIISFVACVSVAFAQICGYSENAGLFGAILAVGVIAKSEKP